MKRLVALLVLLVAACASNPDRLAGRYAVVLDPALDRFPPGREGIVSALRDRLQNVDFVPSRDVQGYDAVIVLSRGPSGRWNINPPPPQPHAGSTIHLVHYEIVREGRVASAGDARVVHTWPPSRHDINPPAREPGGATSHQIQQAYAGGIEVARTVTKALRD
jgi:hypothetical protein